MSRLGKTLLKVNTSLEGEPIEHKVERIVNSKEPISDSAPLIYTDRKDGVQPQYDIRTDRMDIAIDAMDKVAESRLLIRSRYLDARDKKPDPPQGEAV